MQGFTGNGRQYVTMVDILREFRKHPEVAIMVALDDVTLPSVKPRHLWRGYKLDMS